MLRTKLDVSARVDIGDSGNRFSCEAGVKINLPTAVLLVVLVAAMFFGGRYVANRSHAGATSGRLKSAETQRDNPRPSSS